MGAEANATWPTARSSSTVFQRNESNVTMIAPTMGERERIRMEFYQTYDVMTGIRIAVTLGGFFGLMVLLVLYKSKCKSQPDEDLEAAISAAVVAEEEEMEAALNEGRLLSCSSEPRASLGNMSAPVYTRFSSVGGGYNSLLNPTMRKYQFNTKGGRVSLPTSEICLRRLSRLSAPNSDQEIRSGIYRSYNEEDENDLEEELEDDQNENYGRYLQVPNGVRRLSSLCESTSDRIHLVTDETADDNHRRHHVHNFREKSDDVILLNPIDIQVIQPTPQVSPRSSSSGLSESRFNACPGHLFRDKCAQLQAARNKLSSVAKLAPLASMGSCSVHSSESSEIRSVGSDSVFTRSENADTDEDSNKSLKSDREDRSIKSEPLNATLTNSDCTNKKYRIIDVSTCDVDKTIDCQSDRRLSTGSRRRYSDSSVQIQGGIEESKYDITSSVRLFKRIGGSTCYETRNKSDTRRIENNLINSRSNSSNSSCISLNGSRKDCTDNENNEKVYRMKNCDDNNGNNSVASGSSTVSGASASVSGASISVSGTIASVSNASASVSNASASVSCASATSGGSIATSGSSNYYSSASTLSNIGRKYSLTRIAVIEESSSDHPSSYLHAGAENTDVKTKTCLTDTAMASSRSCDRLISPTSASTTDNGIGPRHFRTLSLKSVKSGWRSGT